ncbi:hypothetical protein B0T26DRAFT_647738 [Lasiosphaeria miniovina]|uniref:polynucleotide adenylyltransferase n=1 Tax=Lasiosphaeria miniovina TaxID=1954250 RepID=A0AA40E0K6_9PEZI|nr:uncharacterized protein B0T26DRAFT_647738 [Lasiosphaeria miniovina]KAK0718248.1 hypothetical protein B0T26DRAFT_647738 [Lasiosphaeria miniovina]
MASLDAIPLASHDTALCIIPPRHLWPAVDSLRALYDKAHGKWPPHVNVIYPFVRPEALGAAAERVAAAVSQRGQDDDGEEALRLSLDAAGVFAAHNKKHDNTIYLHDSDYVRCARLKRLRRHVLAALGPSSQSHQQAANNFQMHMTVAQSADAESATHGFLVDKVRLLPAVAWDVGELCILVRERVQLQGAATSQMKLWASVSLFDGSVTRPERPLGFRDDDNMRRPVLLSSDDSGNENDNGEDDKDRLQTNAPYRFDGRLWRRYPAAAADARSVAAADAATPPAATLSISSYNVLAEFDWPASEARYPLLLKNLLADNAAADMVILQEVTDSFLTFLLGDGGVRAAYPFSSHGPPAQPDVAPLPSLLNTVVLSRRAFDWQWLPFRRQHKGAVVARFHDVGKRSEAGHLVPVVFAAVHLTCGLTDGAVAAKRTDVQRLLRYLASAYAGHAWVMVGDFNISTSSYSIGAALEKKTLSPLSAGHLGAFDALFADAALDDAWRVAAGAGAVGEELYDGEQGATYDPTVNGVAAAIVGSGANMRPQRYDRILVRGEGLLKVARFNRFGFIKGRTKGGSSAEPSYASDHWGVRCVVAVGGEDESDILGNKLADEETSSNSFVVPVYLVRAPESLSAAGTVQQCLADLGVIPSEDEISKRKAALSLLKSVLLDTPASPRAAADTPETTARPLQPVAFVVVPVGSYALGVWTAASDMDVLCIGQLSANTFFALATQRLRKAAATTHSHDMRILRRVKAHSGTMLELEVLGIKMDLQYCPAGAVAESWPAALRLPSTNPVWSLSASTLAKLKAARDADYLARSVPDRVAFRAAHRFVKTWARSRGIYAARFGFLGGVQVSILLARVCKLLAQQQQPSSRETLPVGDILVSFFQHYATFDWATQMVFDPLFHRYFGARPQPPYSRNAAREPLAILGYFPPALNTAHAASVPSTRTIADEFRRAAALLSPLSPGGDGEISTTTTWTSFLAPETVPATAFLAAYKTYVKIEIQYWGLSLAKGQQFIGWLESRCVMMLVDLARRAPALHARMWPARFVEVDADANSGAPAPSFTRQNDNEDDDGTTTREYRGCYLIGLDVADVADNKTKTSREDIKLALGGVQTALGRFEEQMRGDERFYDAKSSWIGAEIVKGRELAAATARFEVDAREWGDYTPGDELSSSEDDEDDDGDDDEDYGADDNEDDGRLSFGVLSHEEAKRRRSKKRAESKNKKTEEAVKLDTGRKFRTAADVMNRLRWDGGFAEGDFLVGYEDRFVGACERPLDAWKTEQTDEEFIPQHRILYFKRRSDGVVVWERRTRLDEIFGSGV